MAGRKLDNAVYNVDTSWKDETESKDVLKKGWYNIEFSNMNSSSESILQAGSSIDIDGVVYVFDSNETPTGSSATGTNYVRVYDSGGTALVEYSQTAPTYDHNKKGYYNGLYRYILQFKYDGSSLYVSKLYLIQNSIENKILNDKILSMLIFQMNNTYNTLTPIGSSTEKGFGKAVASSNDYLVVGSYQDSSAGTDAGAVYVFKKLDGITNWSMYTRLVGSDTIATDNFGTAVAIDGDYIVVGAPLKHGSDSDLGAAYVFHRTGDNVWDTGVRLAHTPVTAYNEKFGIAVAISGNYVIVKNNWEDGDGPPDTSKTWSYLRTGTNTWSSEVLISSVDDGYNGLDFNGDYVITGGAQYNYNYTEIVHRTGSNTWDSGFSLEIYGYGCGISEDWAAVGNSSNLVNIYKRTDTNTWVLKQTLEPLDSNFTNFGRMIALRGNYLVVAYRKNSDYYFSVYKKDEYDIWNSIISLDKNVYCKTFCIDNNIIYIGNYDNNEVYGWEIPVL